LFCVPTQLILRSGAQVKKLPENRVTEKSKSSVELAGNAGPPGVGPPKQTKLPLPSHPPEFRPLGGPDAVKPAGPVAEEKLPVPPGILLKAKDCTPNRPPSVSAGPLMPVTCRSKETVVAFNGDVACRT